MNSPRPGGLTGFTGFGGAGLGGGTPEDQQRQMEKMMENAMNNCLIKGAISGVMGFGMGALFGMFMASQTPISSLPLRQQLTLGFKDMGARSYSTAKNFGKLGALYAGIECGVEGFRGKNDLTNSAVAGCLTGGIISRNGGPTAALGGCAAFAAFGVAIDAWMRSPKDDD